MKKQGKKIIGIMLALVLALTCVPVTNAKATTIVEMATQTIKLNEFDTIQCRCADCSESGTKDKRNFCSYI
jgi:hypothetical protein